jgi:hypothetical protein
LPAEAEEEMTFDCQVEATTIMEGAVVNSTGAPPAPRNLAEKVRKVRPFSCDICNKMFTRIEILRRHLKTHMEDKVPRPAWSHSFLKSVKDCSVFEFVGIYMGYLSARVSCF